MFSEKQLKRLERTVNTTKLWSSVEWESEGENFRFTFTPNLNITYDAILEIEASDMDELTRKICDTYEGFDPDYETYLWLGADGHGQNGAPYHIRDILDEFEQLDKAYEELYKAF